MARIHDPKRLQALKDLSFAEQKAAWYPPPEMRDLTLSDQDLEKHCPLTQSRGSEDARTDLGRFGLLPLEVFRMILLQLDIQSLWSLQRANRQMFDAIHTLPQLGAIIKHCPDLVRAALGTKIAPFVDCQQLYDKLTSNKCESCARYGGHLYLLTCTRVCIRCFTQLDRYTPILRLDARRKFGLKPKEMQALPHLTSLPGRYTAGHGPWRKRFVLVDLETTKQIAIRLHGYNLANDPSLCSTGSQRHPRYFNDYETYENNMRRFMSIVDLPYLDPTSGRLHWSFCCSGCYGHADDETYRKNEYIVPLFRDHLRQFGPVVDSRHMTPSEVINDDDV